MHRELLDKVFSLESRTVLVTGGYNGIGRAFAETYAAAGAEVIIAARNGDRCRDEAQRISDQYAVKTAGVSLDVNDSSKVNSVVESVIDQFGKIDILVNSAGISGSEKPVLLTKDEEMDQVMNVDFRGTFLVSRKVAEEMVKKRSGRIINISSILGKIAARNMAGYCASKAAVIQLTRVMALELMRDNVQVNVLCPGYFLTDFNEGFFSSEVGQKMVKKMIPLGRVGSLDELRSTILYLGTCPPFFTGAELYIDGGHTIA